MTKKIYPNQRAPQTTKSTQFAKNNQGNIFKLLKLYEQKNLLMPTKDIIETDLFVILK